MINLKILNKFENKEVRTFFAKTFKKFRLIQINAALIKPSLEKVVIIQLLSFDIGKLLFHRSKILKQVNTKMKKFIQ